MPVGNVLKRLFKDIYMVPDEIISGRRYAVLKRNIIILMLMVTLVPLALLAAIDYYQYQSRLKVEILTPMRSLASKTKFSFELFMRERLAAVSFIAQAYSLEDLTTGENLGRIFRAAQAEFEGLIDLAVLDGKGVVRAYVGPYALEGESFAATPWFRTMQARGKVVSNVVRKDGEVPHLVIAVEPASEKANWSLRAGVDIVKFKDIVASLNLGGGSDAFIVNREGVLQTPSAMFGDVLDKVPFALPQVGLEPQVSELESPKGTELYMTSVACSRSDFILMLAHPKEEVFRSWSALRGEIVLIFLLSVLIDFAVVFKLTGILVNRIKESDQKRELMFREVEHTQKLSSIGRLAAGVAHEINNPLAIINEKAGLLKDLISMTEGLPKRDKFLKVTDSILGSVVRCRTITHRLLGFARRMEVQVEELEINDVMREVLGFLEKEALYRKISLDLDLAENLPRVVTDRGQVQQVFLNILNNAMQAVADEGHIAIRSFMRGSEQVALAIADDGCGMNEETLKHIFEPFFTTKGSKGTGLGLSITYGIVNKLGGELEVKSTPGKGTTFTVVLPLTIEKTEEDGGGRTCPV